MALSDCNIMLGFDSVSTQFIFALHFFNDIVFELAATNSHSHGVVVRFIPI